MEPDITSTIEFYNLQRTGYPDGEPSTGQMERLEQIAEEDPFWWLGGKPDGLERNFQNEQ